jgi:hypothetical protein
MRSLQNLKSRKPMSMKRQHLSMKKGLTRKQASYALSKRKLRGDYRGMQYNRATGKTTLI